jgi:hypothetical protein
VPVRLTVARGSRVVGRAGATIRGRRGAIGARALRVHAGRHRLTLVLGRGRDAVRVTRTLTLR